MKVAIIGAGVCGLYLGWKLAEQKNEVDIFEKKNEVGNNVCSGLFSKRILDFIPESEKLVENRINSVFIHFPKKTVKVEFSKEFLLMSHSELDKLAYNLARSAGAKVFLKKPINSIPKGYDRIIGCDGFDSITRKDLKLFDPKFRLGIQGIISKTAGQNFVDVWPLEKKDGFIWKIPRANEFEYGIMGNPLTAAKNLNLFLNKEGIVLENIASKIIPMGLVLPENEEITLCGDSAGMTKPWSGGGVIWGLIAADILVKSFPDFKKYGKKTKGFFKWKIKRSKILTYLVYFCGFKAPWLLPGRVKIESDFLF